MTAPTDPAWPRSWVVEGKGLLVAAGNALSGWLTIVSQTESGSCLALVETEQTLCSQQPASCLTNSSHPGSVYGTMGWRLSLPGEQNSGGPAEWVGDEAGRGWPSLGQGLLMQDPRGAFRVCQWDPSKASPLCQQRSLMQLIFLILKLFPGGKPSTELMMVASSLQHVWKGHAVHNMWTWGLRCDRAISHLLVGSLWLAWWYLGAAEQLGTAVDCRWWVGH